MKTAIAFFVLFSSVTFAQDPVVKSSTATPGKQESNPAAIELELVRKFNRPTGSVIAIELSPDRKFLAAAGIMKKITLRNTKTWKVVAASEPVEGMILDLAFAPDGKHLIAVSDPNHAIVFETKSLKPVHTYKIQFRPERIAVVDGDSFMVGGRNGSRKRLGIIEKVLEPDEQIHHQFIGGMCTTDSNKVVYTAGDRTDGTYFLARKIKTLQTIASIPERPARLTTGKDDSELLLTSKSKAMVIDPRKQEVLQTWNLPKAQKVEDIAYLNKLDAYVTVSKAGLIEFWIKGYDKPVGSKRGSKNDVYQVIPLDDNRLLTCCRQKKNSVAVWKIKSDPKQLTEIRKKSKTADKPKTKTKRQWTRLNDEFEILEIAKNDIVVELESTMGPGEYDWKVMELELKKEPVPESLKKPVKFHIHDAVVSKNGKFYLATSFGLMVKDRDEWIFIADKSKKVIKAASISQEPVDGILIGRQGSLEVLELKDDGKIISRGSLMDENEAKELLKNQSRNEPLKVSQVILSGSDYLAQCQAGIFRYVGDQSWEKISTTTPVVGEKFALLSDRTIVTSRTSSAGYVYMKPFNGSRKKVKILNQRQSNKLSRVSGMTINKFRTDDEEGATFLGFFRSEKNGSSPVHAACCYYDGAFNRLFNNSQIDWPSVEVDTGEKLEDTPQILEFHPGPNLRRHELWFLTARGLGLVTGKQTADNNFTGEKVYLFTKPFPGGVRLARMKDAGNGQWLIFPQSSSSVQSIFVVRRIQSK